METAPKLYHVVNRSADRDTGVDAFFETLRQEQTRFLDTIGRARSLLGSESGQLAEVTAAQGVLTRQFLDAQRSIMKRRAEVDAEVAVIIKEAASLSTVILGGFESAMPASATAQRQLAELLDDWWRAENLNGRAVLDAARATARSGAGPSEVAFPPPSRDAPEYMERLPPRCESSTPIPSQMVTVLETAESAELLSLLTNLAESLKPPAAAPAPYHAPRIDDLVIRLYDAPAAVRPTDATPEETFREFWHERSVRRIDSTEPSRPLAPERAVKSIAAHILLPMTVVTSALALVMAWIG